MDDERDHRTARVHHRRRAVRDRPPAVPRSAGADARRLPRRDRARRASTTADIDGLSTYPGPMGTPAGFCGAGAYDVMDALRLNCGWYGSGLETSGQLGSVMNACLAVASGLANHVLCFRSVYEGSAQGDKGRAGGHARWRRRRRRRLQGVGLHAVEPAVLGAVGRDLDRDVRAAPLPPVRHDARAARVDRARTRAATPSSTRRRSTATRCRWTTTWRRA